MWGMWANVGDVGWGGGCGRLALAMSRSGASRTRLALAMPWSGASRTRLALAMPWSGASRTRLAPAMPRSGGTWRGGRGKEVDLW